MTDDLGPPPTAHPRELLVSRAGADLTGLLVEWGGRHAMTSSEALLLLAAEMHSILSYCVAAERRAGGGEATP